MSSPREPITIDEFLAIGRNAQWIFGVGRVNDRWLGVARALTEPYMHIFAEVSENYQLGMTDKDQAVSLTCALADDPEQCFGPVENWLVEKWMRGDPERWRCGECDTIGCDGQECQDWDSEGGP